MNICLEVGISFHNAPDVRVDECIVHDYHHHHFLLSVYHAHYHSLLLRMRRTELAQLGWAACKFEARGPWLPSVWAVILVVFVLSTIINVDSLFYKWGESECSHSGRHAAHFSDLHAPH